jgi:hypothetical protein
MTAPLAMFLATLLWTGQSPTPKPTPTVYPSPRLAAVAFAIENGYNIPRTNVVVANEPTYGGTNDVPRLPTDRRTKLPQEETIKDAEAIAKLLGPEVRTGWARELLQCPRSSNNCTLTTGVAVLVIEELPNNETVSMLKFYTPGKSLYWAQVDTQKTAAGWIATRFASGPR